MVQPLWKTAQQCLIKLNIQPSNPTPSYLPKKMKTYVHWNDLYTDVHSNVIHNSVCTGATPSPLETAKYLSGGECINKFLLGPHQECHIAIKRKEILVRTATWTNFKNLWQVKEARYKRKNIYCIITNMKAFTWNSRKGKLSESR